jgi:hypothetical protein
MKTPFALVACAMLCSRVLLANDFSTNLEVRLDSVPLRIVLQTYARESGIRVEVVEGVDAQITLRTDKAVIRAEFLQLIQRCP